MKFFKKGLELTEKISTNFILPKLFIIKVFSKSDFFKDTYQSDPVSIWQLRFLWRSIVQDIGELDFARGHLLLLYYVEHNRFGRLRARKLDQRWPRRF
jgi:hypothetical protein